VAGAPGADDNGSGSILLLELLRRLAERPPAGLRVVVVWFGAEERIGGSGHHFGSRHAAEEMTAAGDLPDLMLSVDMVGVGDRLYSVGYRDHGVSLADEVVAAAADVGIEATYVSRGEISDHVPFARAGVPAALLLRPDNPAWHKPSDDVVSDEVLLATLRVLEALVDRLDRAHRGLAPIRPTPPVG
jgi:aminopeptidase YwaD